MIQYGATVLFILCLFEIVSLTPPHPRYHILSCRDGQVVVVHAFAKYFNVILKIRYRRPSWRTIWMYVWSNKRREITKCRYVCNVIWAKTDGWIFCVSLSTCTCNIWRNALIRNCRSIRCHIKCSFDTLITAWFCLYYCMVLSLLLHGFVFITAWFCLYYCMVLSLLLHGFVLNTAWFCLYYCMVLY